MTAYTSTAIRTHVRAEERLEEALREYRRARALRHTGFSALPWNRALSSRARWSVLHDLLSAPPFNEVEAAQAARASA